MFDYLKIHYDELLTHCGPGEQPLALVSATYIEGDEGSVAPSGVTFDMHGLSVAAWEHGIEGLLAGKTLFVSRGITALHVKQATLGSPDLLLTTHRLIALDDGMLGSDNGARVTWAIPLSEVATIRHSPRFFQAGRLLIAFADGSAIRLMAGIVFAKRAKAFAAAFHHLTGR